MCDSVLGGHDEITRCGTKLPVNTGEVNGCGEMERVYVQVVKGRQHVNVNVRCVERLTLITPDGDGERVDFAEIMRTLGFSRPVSMENFRTPNFPLVATCLSWLINK